MPVCIVGMHRSGTSMIAQLLTKCGLYLGSDDELLPPVEDNPSGYWENIKFVDFNEELLASAGYTWHKPPQPGNKWLEESRHLNDFEHRATDLVSEFDNASSWGWKDPRNSLTLPFWLKILPDLKILVCLRNPAETARSMDIRENARVEFNKSLNLWQVYYEHIILSLPEHQFLVTHYNTYFYNPLGELNRLLKFLDIGPENNKEQEAISHIKSSLHRNFRSEHILEQMDIPDSVLHLYKGLCQQCGPHWEALTNDADFQLKQLRRETTLLFQEVVSKSQKAEIAETQLRQSQAAIQHSEAQLRQSQAAIQHSEAQLRQSQAAFQRLETQLRESRTAVQRLGKQVQKLQQSEVKSEQLETRLRKSVRAKDVTIDSLRDQLTQLRKQKRQLQDELNRLYSSRFWRFWLLWRKVIARVFPRINERVQKTALESQVDVQPVTSMPIEPDHAFSIYPLQSDYTGYDLIQPNEPSIHDLYRQMYVSKKWKNRPSFSIVTPIYSPPTWIFEELVNSVKNQTYDNWEWVTADASPDEEIWTWLQDLAQRDARIKPVRIEENNGISANTNIALENINGDYVVLLDHDDVLTSNALFEVAQVIQQFPEADLIYSDEDKISENGYRCQPVFKADFSPAMMLCANQITHLAVFRSSLLDKIGPFNSEMDGAQDWDMFLRISEQTNAVYHIPKVLYGWRKTPQSTAQSRKNKNVRHVQCNAVKQHLERLDFLDPIVFHDDNDKIRQVHPVAHWKQQRDRKISIILVNHDPSRLKQNLQTLFSITEYYDFEVILVDDQSSDDVRQNYVPDSNIIVHQASSALSFVQACNEGAEIATGELLLFFDNSLEVRHSDWLDRMAQWFEFEDIGIVGAQILYPNNRVKHAGLALGLNGLANSLFFKLPHDAATIFGSPKWYRDLLAVSGDCLLIRKELFEEVGGFDEDFERGYYDIDLCLRSRNEGYRTVYTPDAQFIYHGEDIDIPKNDQRLALQRFKALLIEGDPYYNPNLSVSSFRPILRKSDTDVSYNIYLEWLSVEKEREVS